MLEIKLIGVSPDGEGHVVYLQIVDDTGKVLQSNCIPYTTETKFNVDAKKILADFKTGHDIKEDIKSKAIKKLSAINLTEKGVKV